MNTFTGKEFAESLSSPQGIVLPEVPLALIGLAMKSRTVNSIDFAPGARCGKWVTIPVALIDKIDHFQKVSCNDHEHDYVRVHFAAPTTDEGKVFARLVSTVLIVNDEGRNPSEAQQATPAAGDAIEAFGFHPPHIPTPNFPSFRVPTPGAIRNVRCAQCIAANMALALAVTAAVAALGPEIGAATAVSTIMAQFGVSQAIAVAAVAGASGAAISKMMCFDKHIC